MLLLGPSPATKLALEFFHIMVQEFLATIVSCIRFSARDLAWSSEDGY